MNNKSPEQLANEIIETMESFGLTPDEMLEVIKLVREKLESNIGVQKN